MFVPPYSYKANAAPDLVGTRFPLESDNSSLWNLSSGVGKSPAPESVAVLPTFTMAAMSRPLLLTGHRFTRQPLVPSAQLPHQLAAMLVFQ